MGRGRRGIHGSGGRIGRDGRHRQASQGHPDRGPQQHHLGDRTAGAANAPLILDLNGHTITSGSIVVINYGNLTIRDTSAAQSGRIVFPGDPEGKSYVCPVGNQGGGTLTLESGTISCEGSALTSYSAAISTSAGSTTIINGGTLSCTGQNGSGLISYGTTIVNGGTLNATYGAMAKSVSDNSSAGTVEFPADSTAVVNAASMAFVVQGTSDDVAGQITAAGGTFNAQNVLGKIGSAVTAANHLTLTGGSFSADPSSFAGTNAVAALTNSGGTRYLVGGTIAGQAALAQDGDVIDILSGDAALTGLPTGVEVKNSGSGSVSVNGDALAPGASVVVCAHVWGAPVFQWSADYQSCTALFTCQNDAAHTVTLNAAVTSAVASQPTCTAAGVTRFTAKVTHDGKEYIGTAEAPIAATGHGATELRSAKAASCTEEGYTGDKVCTVCGQTVEKGTVLARLAAQFPERRVHGVRHGRSELHGPGGTCGLVLSERPADPATAAAPLCGAS